MVVYYSPKEIILLTPEGAVTFENVGSAYRLKTNDESIMARVEALPGFKQGLIHKEIVEDEPVPVVEESPRKVKNAKQAIEWLVRNKGEKRGVYTKEQIRALAAKHGVEFVNWK